MFVAGTTIRIAKSGPAGQELERRQLVMRSGGVDNLGRVDRDSDTGSLAIAAMARATAFRAATAKEPT